MKIWVLTKIGLKECLRQRVVYFIFVISLLFVFMAKGCDIGTVKGENLLLGKDARQSIAVGLSFNGIVFWSIMLCGLLASQALTRETDEGLASVTLARPLSRDTFIAGKLLPVLIISTLNLIILGSLFCLFYYKESGAITLRLPLSFLFMTFSVALYGLMILCLSLFIPKLLAPLAGIVVYMLSCWSSLPYFFESLKIVWTPSATVDRMHMLLPKFGDLQYIGSSIINGQKTFDTVNPLIVLCNIAAYACAFWFVTVWAFKRREL
jgi:ABC-type transport system involved in multi-copper enzyme maturation permease subunit